MYDVPEFLLVHAEAPPPKMNLYDASRKKIEPPLCKVCQEECIPLMGKRAMAWHCHKHGFGVTE